VAVGLAAAENCSVSLRSCAMGGEQFYAFFHLAHACFEGMAFVG